MAGRIERPSVRGGTPLLQRRIGASIIRSGWHVKMQLNKAKWGWPTGKLVLYRDRLEIRFLLIKPQILSISEITAIWRTLITRVLVEHSNEEVPDHIVLSGWGLYDALKDAVRKNGLDIKIG
jgi:hypothetical protein